MPDYSLGKIYMLHCIDNQNDDEPIIYYGSTTTLYLNSRLSKHKDLYKRYLNGANYSYTSFKLFDKYGIDNVTISLVESYPCNNRNELEEHERFFIESNNCINKNIPTRTRYETNKAYYESNHQKIRDYANTKHICYCKGSFSNANKNKHLKSNKHIRYIIN
jgi:hypothetical protein